MMYIHFCKHCTRIHILNGHKTECPRCSEKLTELKVSYMEYINLDLTQRDLLIEKCKDENQLSQISTIYRMYKYSKAYKSLHNSEASGCSTDEIQ